MLKRILAATALLFATSVFAAVEVNKASADELDTLKGVGPVMAKRIVEERSKNGNFKSWDDLVSRVKGTGGGAAAKLSSEGLTVNGQQRAVTAQADAKKTDPPGVATGGHAERRLPTARPDEPRTPPAGAETKADKPGVATGAQVERRMPTARGNESGSKAPLAEAAKK